MAFYKFPFIKFLASALYIFVKQIVKHMSKMQTYPPRDTTSFTFTL